jgi:hypothetical protein
MIENAKAATRDEALTKKILDSDYSPLAASSVHAHASIQIAIQIQKILDAYPDLLNHGWRTPTDSTTPIQLTSTIVRQVQLTIAYLNIHKIHRTTSSYSLKHLVERWSAKNKREPYTYVQNSSAIVGALLSGYTLVLLKSRPHPNVWFKRGVLK